MKLISKLALAAATLLPATPNAGAAIEGSLDPPSVVAEWSNSSTYPKIIDINFSDEMWPGQTWTGETGMDCPEYADGGYVNTVIEVPANGGTEIKYPVLFHNCIFANKKSYNGYAGATAAFCRQYYMYNPQIQIFAESETKRPFFECSFKTKRTKKGLAHNTNNKARNKSQNHSISGFVKHNSTGNIIAFK